MINFTKHSKSKVKKTSATLREGRHFSTLEPIGKSFNQCSQAILSRAISYSFDFLGLDCLFKLLIKRDNVDYDVVAAGSELVEFVISSDVPVLGRST